MDENKKVKINKKRNDQKIITTKIKDIAKNVDNEIYDTRNAEDNKKRALINGNNNNNKKMIKINK